MSKASTRTIWLLIANFIGVALYLFFASWSWIEPELADIPGASGGAAVVWFVTAVPIFLVFQLGNTAVGVVALFVRIRSGAWPITKLLWVSVPIWLCAVVLDFSRHGS